MNDFPGTCMETVITSAGVTIILSNTPTEMISDALKMPLDKVTKHFFLPHDFFS